MSCNKMKSTASEWYLWCRLCGDKDSRKHMELFPPGELEAVIGDGCMYIVQVIEKHFDLKISVDDVLPKMICQQCYKFLCIVTQINDSILKVQEMFQELYASKLEMEKQSSDSDQVKVRKDASLDGNLAAEDISRAEIQISIDRLQRRNKEHVEMDIICKDCGQSFQYFKPYRQHLSEQHGNRTDHGLERQCLLCGEISTSNTSFRKHLLTHESSNQTSANDLPDNDVPTEQLLLCPECEEQFPNKRKLQQHQKSFHKKPNTLEKPKVKKPAEPQKFICEECGACLRNSVNLKIHLQRHSDDAPFECEVCKKRFKNPRRLKIHSETHTSHKHICPICGLQLNAKNTLRRHRLVHSNERKHKCDYCGRGFKTSDGLKSHLMAHAGIKPYACNFCDRAFSCAVNCRLHKKNKHAKELDALEANGGVEQIVQKIPSLETLKALIKGASGGLNPVAKYKRKENIS